MHNILAQITVADIGTFEQAEFKTVVDTSSSQTILEILKSFGVEGQIVGTETGPIVTSVYFAPAPGIRINSITERTDDLQVALGVSSLKITLAPEKKAVAIEVPNPHPCKIPFGNIFHSAHNGMRLPAALGVDTKGNPVYLDIAQTPHLLIAGQTGSGKSVCLNSIIVSLALHCRPVDLQFLLIDPKRVEFFPYEQMHNLISGHVIKNVDEAIHSLKWLVQEMEVRNTILEKCRCRNINDFKKKLNQGQIEGMPIPYTQDMPYIVAVIDEYADLMMRSSKDLTDCIMALAQKARSVGIHLILATQRPSTKVISGDIKANFPTRIALKTAVATDSSTILGCGGAEKLLGKGDMLLSCDGDIRRIHGCYISDEEIDKAISALPSDNLFYFNNENIFTTDFEAYISNQFKDRPTWGEINAVCKAYLENLNDYFVQKEIAVNLNVSKEELADIWQQIRTACENPEICKQIAEHYIKNPTIAESKFVKFIIYTNFNFKDSEGNNPFITHILEKAINEGDKTALISVGFFCNSIGYDNELIKKEITAMCESNEKAKEFIYEHFENFKSIIIEWAQSGDERAKKIIYKHYNNYEEFKKCLVQMAENEDTMSRNIIFNYYYYFKDTIVEWADKGIERAAKIFEDNPDKFIDTIMSRTINGDEKAQKAFCNLCGNTLEYKDTLIKLANEENEFAKLSRSSINKAYPKLSKEEDFTKAFVFAANQGNAWAKDFILTHHVDFGKTIDIWVKQEDSKTKEFIYNNPLDFKGFITDWASNKDDERAKVIVYEHPFDFKDTVIDWACNKDDERAKEIILNNYNEFTGYKLENTITLWADNGNKNAKDFIYDNPALFKDVIINWLKNNQDAKARETIYSHPLDFKDTIIDWASNKYDERAKEIILNNYSYNGFADCNLENTITLWANNGNKNAKDFIYNKPFYFKDTIIEWANNNDEKAKESIYKEYSYFKGTIIKWANEGIERAKNVIYGDASVFESVLFDWANKDDKKAQEILIESYKTEEWGYIKETFINQAIRWGNLWAINFICTNITEFKENLINEIKKVNQKITRAEDFDVNFLNEIFQLANNGNKDATKIAQYIAETEIISHYLENGDSKIVKDFVWSYWPKDNDRSKDFSYYVIRLAREGDEEAQELIISSLYECMDDRDDPYYEFVIDNYDSDWVHDFICEWWWGHRELEKIFFRWVREWDSLARGRFFEELDEYIRLYEALENSDFRKTIISLTDEGNERTKKIILENFDFFRDDKIEDTIIKWAKSGDKEAEDAIATIYNHYDEFKESIIRLAERGEKEAIAIVYDHYDEFEDSIIKWANENNEKAQNLIKENLNQFKDSLISSAIAGKEWSKNIILDSYYDYFEYEHDLDDSIVKWAKEGDKRAQKIKEDLDAQNRELDQDDLDYLTSLF